MTIKPYTLTQPASRTTCVVFASPHSGRDYLPSFVGESVLKDRLLRSSEDAFVDRLFAAAPGCGAPFLIANAPRAYVDLNRGADELDPALIQGLKHVAPNPRVSSGLGVIPRVVAGGRAIYRGKITLACAQARLARYWYPYHGALQTLLDESVDQFGKAILIDCHSMPHEAILGHANAHKARPEVVLGDRFGASAAPEIVDRVEHAFQQAGFITARNTPFSGAYIAQHYGRPSRRQHVVQVEIDRALYMDERAVRPARGFEDVRERLAAVVAEIVALGRCGEQLAAE